MITNAGSVCFEILRRLFQNMESESNARLDLSVNSMHMRNIWRVSSTSFSDTSKNLFLGSNMNCGIHSEFPGRALQNGSSVGAAGFPEYDALLHQIFIHGALADSLQGRMVDTRLSFSS